MRDDFLLMGAVAYDPKVVTIWNGFRDYFLRNGLAFDYVLFSNYERQVEAHFAGLIHVAWNSPLAWIQTERIARESGRKAEAICMRDSDCDLTSVIITHKPSSIQSTWDLKGKRVAVGAHDSPQATLIPLSLLAREGLEAHRDFEVIAFDVLVGLHGDHIGGERDAAKALLENHADAACLLEANYDAFQSDGTIPTDSTRVIARTGEFDHCNFTVLDNAPRDKIAKFRELLLAMNYSNPELKPLLDMEGLKQWKPGRTVGYPALSEAVDRFGTINEFVKSAASRCN